MHGTRITRCTIRQIMLKINKSCAKNYTEINNEWGFIKDTTSSWEWGWQKLWWCFVLDEFFFFQKDLSYSYLLWILVKVVTNQALGITWENQTLPAYQYFENIRNFLVAVDELKIPSFEASDIERVKVLTLTLETDKPLCFCSLLN